MLHTLRCALCHFWGLIRVCHLPAADGGGSKLSHYLCIDIIAIHVCAWNGARLQSRAPEDMTNCVSGAGQGRHSYACDRTGILTQAMLNIPVY